MARTRFFYASAALMVSALIVAGGLRADDDKEERKYNLIYVPTPEVVVEKMLDMAKVTNKDVVFDLGCGDGRVIAIAAKKFGTRGVGIDLNPERIKEAHETVKKYGVGKLVELREGDALKVKDFNRATVVALYMLPEFMNWLEPIAKKTLKPGTRIVSHDYKWESDWTPEQTIEFKGPDRTHTLYLWTVPNAFEERKYNLIYVPTPEVVVEKMLDMAKVTKKDVVFDLGCGDGRVIAIAAKKFGTHGVGIDLNPERIKEARATVKKYGVGKLVELREGDALKVKDFNRATVVALYMLPEFMNWLEPIAKKTLKPGTRIVSHDYRWESDWTPEQTIEFKGPDRTHTLYLWTVPKSK